MTQPPERPDERPDDDDELLLALARRARAPQWEDLAHGRLSLVDAQRERADAGDSAETIERASAYFRPFDADEQASLVDSLLAGLADEPSSEVVPLRPRAAASSRWVVVGTVLAIAAAVSLWWLWPRDPDSGSDAPEIARLELPDYELETEGGLKPNRDTSSEPERALEYERDSRFEWVLRPQTAVDGPVEVRGFVFSDPAGAGRTLELGALVQIGESGSIRIRGTIAELGLATGEFVIALVVGRAGELPEAGLGLDAIERGGWQVARLDLVIR